MHGTILVGLKKFVEHNAGPASWTAVLQKAGLGSPLYVSSRAYPDEEVVKIVGAASVVLGRSVSEVLEAFGASIVPDLIAVYGALLDPSWRTLDVIERTEQTIHRVVRLRDPQATPPELFCTRVSVGEVTIEYASARKLCFVAKGIVRGIAQHFREKVEISEASCMLTGADICKLSVTQAS